MEFILEQDKSNEKALVQNNQQEVTAYSPEYTLQSDPVSTPASREPDYMNVEKKEEIQPVLVENM